MVPGRKVVFRKEASGSFFHSRQLNGIGKPKFRLSYPPKFSSIKCSFMKKRAQQYKGVWQFGSVMFFELKFCQLQYI